ncbi:UNVERIFIED_CONTAM: hypothetical protein FKN15_018881, partial [Acipenser sinensis]
TETSALQLCAELNQSTLPSVRKWKGPRGSWKCAVSDRPAGQSHKGSEFAGFLWDSTFGIELKDSTLLESPQANGNGKPTYPKPYLAQFKLVDIGEKWCSGTPFDLIAAEESDERRLDFYAEPGLSFYVLCPDLSNGADNFLVDIGEKWCSGTPFDLIAAEESDERRLDFYAEPGLSFYVLCPDLSNGADNFHVWSESEDCLPFLQLAQDYISSCGKKTLLEILDKVFKSFRPLLGLPDVDDDAFEDYQADMEEEEPEADHQQTGVSQQ